MNLPNRITLFRFLLVPIFVGVLLYWDSSNPYFKWIAVLIFMAASISDAFDGFIARKYNQVTELGSVLDPIADKLLLASAFLALALFSAVPDSHRLPKWLTLIVISRDIYLLIGSAVIFFYRKSLMIRTNVWGKYTTAFQMVLVLIALIGFSDGVKTAALIAVTVLTILSTIAYTRLGLSELSHQTST